MRLLINSYMAQSKYIQSVVAAQRGRPRSTAWYRDKIKEFGTPKSSELIRDGKQAGKPFYGRLNMFVYGPKHAKTLPYYDTFPLVLPLESYPDGFLGINLHYLPIPLRMALLDKLVDFSTDTNFDEGTTLAVNYSGVKNIKEVRPTIHRYLAGHVKTRFRRIDADEFTVATLLPVQQFKKSSDRAVWSDSRKLI